MEPSPIYPMLITLCGDARMQVSANVQGINVGAYTTYTTRIARATQYTTRFSITRRRTESRVYLWVVCTTVTLTMCNAGRWPHRHKTEGGGKRGTVLL